MGRISLTFIIKYFSPIQVTPDARPFMGPNLYVTPPASFTHFHQDGHGTVDSGHLCISGFNEVVMLRRLTERHKKHALWILSGKKPGGFHFDGLYSMPHGDGLVRQYNMKYFIESRYDV
jgi:hypothetical protein